jgi:hypothetical protein
MSLSANESENNNPLSLKSIPTLTGPDTFVRWNRSIEVYLFSKGAHRVVRGTALEPFRRQVNPEVEGDHGIVYPEGSWAGCDPPTVENSTTGAALTNAQTTQWEKWEEKERIARAAIILTVSPGIAAEIEKKWSSHEMYSHIQATNRVDTDERKAELSSRLSSLKLSPNASRDMMINHIELFNTTAAEAIAAGLVLEDWDRCQRFLHLLSSEFEPLRVHWRLLPQGQKTSWTQLASLYRSQADARADNQSPSINVVFNKDAVSNNNHNNNNRGGGRGRGRGKGNRGGRGGFNKSFNNKGCSKCGMFNHSTEQHRDKPNNGGNNHKSDRLSPDEAKEAIRQYKEQKEKSGNNGNRVNSIEGHSFGSIFSITGSNVNNPDYLVDTGASHHIIGDRSVLSNIRRLPTPIVFRLADGNSITAHEAGDLILTGSTNHSLVIHNVNVCENTTTNILSCGQLIEDGWNVDLSLYRLSKGSHSIQMTRKGRLPFIVVNASASYTPLGHRQARMSQNQAASDGTARMSQNRSAQKKYMSEGQQESATINPRRGLNDQQHNWLVLARAESPMFEEHC